MVSKIKKQVILKASTNNPLRRLKLRRDIFSRNFNYNLDFENLDFKKEPSFYRVGNNETGIYVVEPYASILQSSYSIINFSRAKRSATSLLKHFERFRKENDFIGMDMTRKYIQLGVTESEKNPKNLSDIRVAQTFEEALDFILDNTQYLEARAQWKDLLG